MCLRPEEWFCNQFMCGVVHVHMCPVGKVDGKGHCQRTAVLKTVLLSMIWCPEGAHDDALQVA